MQSFQPAEIKNSSILNMADNSLVVLSCAAFTATIVVAVRADSPVSLMWTLYFCGVAPAVFVFILALVSIAFPARVLLQGEDYAAYSKWIEMSGKIDQIASEITNLEPKRSVLEKLLADEAARKQIDEIIRSTLLKIAEES